MIHFRQDKRIDLFTPPQFEKHPLNINKLNEDSNKKWQYASSGKASIVHILKSFNLPNKILLPVYICQSVLTPLKKLKIEPIFYDVDADDLNGALESIDGLARKYRVNNVLVASMYGNPANLVAIETYCAQKDMKLIDDAAQSYGATLAERYVGTFGNAGFFSFSPGKATAGHMGAFFWTEDQYHFKHTKHCFIHYLVWLDFYFNRYRCYSSNVLFYKNVVNIVKRISLRYVDLYYDKMCKYEELTLGGILDGLLTYMKEFRSKCLKEFCKEFSKDTHFRILNAKRGTPNNHKIVLICENGQLAQKLLLFCKERNVAITNGYKLLAKNMLEVPNAIAIEGRVVELPIVDNDKRMEYLLSTMKDALKTI